MFIGSGAIDAMKKSYENNRNLLGKRKRLKELMYEQSTHHHTKYRFKKANPKSLDDLHKRLQAENRKSLIKQMLVLTFLAIAIFGAMYFFLLTTCPI